MFRIFYKKGPNKGKQRLVCGRQKKPKCDFDKPFPGDGKKIVYYFFN